MSMEGRMIVGRRMVYNTDNVLVKQLGECDNQMLKLIQLIEEVSIPIRENRFESLVRSIVGQQISVKAASTIFERLKNKVGELTPEAISVLDVESLREVGLSKQKISYMKDLCEKIIGNDINLYLLDNLSNEEVIKQLTQVKGIGKWTAEMFLMFSVGRTDVLSLGDAGLQRACKWLYEAKSDADGRDVLKQKGESWSPFSSIASFYLWAAIDHGYVDNYPSIDRIGN